MIIHACLAVFLNTLGTGYYQLDRKLGFCKEDEEHGLRATGILNNNFWIEWILFLLIYLLLANQRVISFKIHSISLHRGLLEGRNIRIFNWELSKVLNNRAFGNPIFNLGMPALVLSTTVFVAVHNILIFLSGI